MIAGFFRISESGSGDQREIERIFPPEIDYQEQIAAHKHQRENSRGFEALKGETVELCSRCGNAESEYTD